MAQDHYDIAIIGGGGAGTMAFLRSVLNYDRSVLFLGDADDKRRGRATWVAEVDNIPGMHDLQRPIISTTASTLKWIAQQEKLNDVGSTIKGSVTGVRVVDDGFKVSYRTRTDTLELAARFVILATGLMDVQPEIGGSIEPVFPFANRGDVLYCLRCDGHRTIGHRLSVIGGGDTGVGIAALMHERYGHEGIAVLSNGESFDAISDRSRELVEAYGLELYEQPLAEVLGEPKGEGLTGFRLLGDTVVETTRCIIALGTIVYNELLTALGGEVDGDGRVIVSSVYETSVPGFFAVGDLVAGRKLQIYTAWDEAVDAADEINRRLRKMKRQAALGR